MKSLLSIAFFFAACAVCSAQTFGLGTVKDKERIETATPSGQTFGLDGEKVAEPAAPKLTITKEALIAKPFVLVTPNPTYPYRSPPGFHRHQLPDGRVFEHSDSNFGDPVAHSGLPGNWPKYYGPRPPDGPAPGTSGVMAFQSTSICPNGICPTGRRQVFPMRFIFRRFR